MDDQPHAESFRILKSLYDHVGYEVHVWELIRDDHGAIRGWRLVDANPKALQVWNSSLDDVVGKSNEELFPDSNSTELFLPLIERIFASNQPYDWEEFFPDTQQMLHMTSIPAGDFFISCGMDVTEYRDVEAALSTTSIELDESMRRLRIATEAAQIGVWEYHLESGTLLWDKSMYRIYGVKPSGEKIPYEVWWNGVHKEDIDRATVELERAIASGGFFRSHFRIVRRDTGEVRHISAQAVTEYDSDRKPIRMIGVNIDETERHDAEEKIEQLAYYDTLTGLPNRTLIEDRLRQAIARSGRMKSRGAVIFIDIDNFKHVNDTVGHALGDELLATIARRLEQLVRSDDTVGRFGGDEFVIIMNNLASEDMAAAKAAEKFSLKVAEAVREPMELSTGTYVASASLGISVFLGPDLSPDEALRQADLAMYRAKEAGRNAVRFFDASMEKDVLERVALERDLEQAIENRQFELHYQPQIGHGGMVRGAEALLRWRHPDRGYIPPNDFIPLAEESGHIMKLGRWVLTRALEDLKHRFGQHIDESFVVAINVSALQFYDADFVEDFSTDILRSGVRPAQIMIELTESALGRTDFDISDQLQALRETGVQFSLDDFGTGYSSLTRVKQLPIDELKIDQSFVRDIATDVDSQAIARSVIALARSMGLGVIAEGVETEQHRDILAEMGCDLYQGYLYARPMDADAFVQFLEQTVADCPPLRHSTESPTD